jgi:hypothetical protein
MKLPGFTAESSLGRPSKVYWSSPFVASKFGRQMPSIMPAQTEAVYADAEEIEETELEDFGAETPELYGSANEVAGADESADEPNDDSNEDAGEPEEGYTEEVPEEGYAEEVEG